MIRPHNLVVPALLGTLAFSAQIPLFPESHSEGSGLNHHAPRGCEVTAASYLIRHASIYCNDDDYERYIEPFLKKLNLTSTSKTNRRAGWEGPLDFFSKWQNPIDDPENQMERITPQGLKDSKKVGKHLLSRYPTLAPTVKSIYADKKSRTQDTAKAFVKHFPQDVEVIEMNKSQPSYYAQAPHKACKVFSKVPGDEEMEQFMETYTIPVIARLQSFSSVELSQKDIVGLQQLCGYASAIDGKVSPICDVFTDNEWMAYEYMLDLKYYYMVGYANPLSPYLGFPWLNTTSGLMSKFHSPMHTDIKPDTKIPNDHGQRLFLAFTHREVPPFLATALGLFNSSNTHADNFPTDRINWSRSWKMAELVPFLGHVGIEKLTCTRESIYPDDDKEYIRIIANTAPRPIPNCQGGPGASCTFDDFTEIIRKGTEKYGDFDGACGNDEDDEEKEELYMSIDIDKQV